MKKLIALATLLLVLPGMAQDLKVVHVSGEIYGDKQGRNLKTGDNLSENDKISYSGTGNICLLYDGQRKLSFKSTVGANSGTVHDFFKTTQNRQSIASRGSEDGDVLKLSDYFDGDKYFFVGKAENVKMNQEFISEKFQFFYVEGEEKTLIPFENSYLKLKVSELFKETENEKEISIYSVNTETGELSKEIDLTISRMSEIELDKQTEVFLSMMNEKTQEEKMEECYQLMRAIYGNLNRENWEAYFSKF